VKSAYRRVLIKLSGEALAGDKGFGISPTVISRLAGELREVHELGTELCVVIGGGNVIRGVAAASQGMDRASADYMGMMAGMINALALQDALEKLGVPTRVQSAISMAQVAEGFIRRRAVRHLEKGRVVIFGAGTGNPYFTTDTAAALRAVEIEADAIIKGTRVDGVYDADPEHHPGALRFTEISYLDVLKKDLKVMDMTAITLCRENKLPILVFNMNTRGNFRRLIMGENVGTTVLELSSSAR